MKNCSTLISKVSFGTKTVLEESASQILAISRSIVPIDTDTLRETGYYYIEGTPGRMDATIGYADAAHDRMNPKSKKMASTYAVVVHEDLSLHHEHGQARFLRDAVAYWASRFPSIVKDVFEQLGII
jgi:hypothetical protein